MTIYYILYTIIIFSALLSNSHNKRSVYLIIAFCIIAFAAFRGNGFDWESYEDIYNSIQNHNSPQGNSFIEYGFEFLCWISPTYSCLIFLVSALSLIFTFKGTYGFSKSYLPVLSLLVFASTLLLPTYMGQIRQGVAIGFVTMAVWLKYNDNSKNAFWWIVAACFFHFSAILTFIILIIPKRRFSPLIYIGFILISLLFYNISLSIMAKFLTLSQLGPAQKLLFYASSEDYELGISSTILIRITTLLLAVFLNIDNKKDISFLCNIYACGIIVYLLFGFIPQLGGRGALYFSVYEMIIIPYIVSQLKQHQFLYFVSYFVIIGLSIIRIVNFFSDNYNSYVPYILNK